MSASKEFFREWFKWFWVSLLIGGILLLLGYLDYILHDRTFDQELLKNALLGIFSTSLFLFPLVELRYKYMEWIYDKIGNPYENDEKFKKRYGKKTVTTIRMISLGFLIGIILVIILNG